MLEQVAMRLPVLETYIGLFGSSENQLLKAPLIDIYTTLILFGIQALKLFDRSKIRKFDFYSKIQTLMQIRYLGPVHMEPITRRLQAPDYEDRAVGARHRTKS